MVLYGISGRLGSPSDITPEELAARRETERASIASRLDRATWPRFAHWLAKAAKPEDAGLGDTAQRLAAKMGGEALKTIYRKVTGTECGCGDRQAKLNAAFPYRA